MYIPYFFNEYSREKPALGLSDDKVGAYDHINHLRQSNLGEKNSSKSYIPFRRDSYYNTFCMVIHTEKGRIVVAPKAIHPL